LSQCVTLKSYAMVCQSRLKILKQANTKLNKLNPLK
jgi:hypothetical protein